MKDLDDPGRRYRHRILWLKPTADPWILKSLTMITEDKNGDAILLSLLNQIDKATTKIKEV